MTSTSTTMIAALLALASLAYAPADAQVHSNFVRSSNRSLQVEFTDPRVVTSGGVEQVHLQPYSPTAMTILWVTESPGQGQVKLADEAGNDVQCQEDFQEVTSQLTWYEKYTLATPDLGNPKIPMSEIARQQNTSVWSDPSWGTYYVVENDTAEAVQWDGDYYEGASYKNPNAYYTSPVIHNVRCPDLKPGATYKYSIDEFSGSFTMPPAPGTESVKLGIWGDVGQTNVSAASMSAMRELDGAQLLLLTGDYSYADGYGPLWDIFGRLMEPLLSEMPMIGVGGNHEVETGEAWVQMNLRYPQPWRSSGSVSPLWYSYETGPAHIVGLNSYARFDQESLQYKWLEEDLEKVDRGRTPWLILMWHTPWYNSNVHHFGEGLLMQESMEELLYRYKVDLVFNGHLHSYERTKPVYKDSISDPCAPEHIIIGDGGNHEGSELNWFPQPEWSAYRESSFGIGELDLINSTHATWTWHRQACPNGDIDTTCGVNSGLNSTSMQVTGKDSVMLVRHVDGSCEDLPLTA